MKKIIVIFGCCAFHLHGMQDSQQPPSSQTTDKQMQTSGVCCSCVSPEPVRPKTPLNNPPLSLEKTIAALLAIAMSPSENAMSQSSEKMPVLHKTASTGDTDSIKKLLEQGNNCNAVDSTGTSPLAYALDNGQYSAVFMLLKKGAYCIKNNKFVNPLFYASQKKASRSFIEAMIGFALETQKDARSSQIRPARFP